MGSFDDLKKLSAAQKTSRKSLDVTDAFEDDELPHDEHALTLTGASGRRLKRELSRHQLFQGLEDTQSPGKSDLCIIYRLCCLCISFTFSLSLSLLSLSLSIESITDNARSRNETKRNETDTTPGGTLTAEAAHTLNPNANVVSGVGGRDDVSSQRSAAATAMRIRWITIIITSAAATPIIKEVGVCGTRRR